MKRSGMRMRRKKGGKEEEGIGCDLESGRERATTTFRVLERSLHFWAHSICGGQYGPPTAQVINKGGEREEYWM
jgi:hypothetical protein